MALIAVLYFLILCALPTTAVLFAERSAARSAFTGASGAQLLGAAEASAFSSLGSWDGDARARQPVGSTTTITHPPADGASTTLYVTRLTVRIFSIMAETRATSGVAARRVALLARLPMRTDQPRAALVSAVNVTAGPNVRFLTDSAACGDSASADVVLAPDAAFVVDTTAHAPQPVVAHLPAAADSSLYLRLADSWWDDVARRADIRLAPGTHVHPEAIVVGGECTSDDANWGDPNSLMSSCGQRAPLVYASGDLTIDGGRGQGVLLVDGRLMIAGSFAFSGQIVARHGIETLADNIAISGAVAAWRASAHASNSLATASDVVLTHDTILRYSRCDAGHRIASSLQPRLVRERAWSELF
jgi:hypothetical protein